MRTDIYLVETEMPGGLQPERHYTSGPGSREKGKNATLVGYAEGRYGSEDFVIPELIRLGISGWRGMTWNPVDPPMTDEECHRAFVADVTSHMRPEEDDDRTPDERLSDFLEGRTYDTRPGNHENETIGLPADGDAAGLEPTTP